MSQIRTLIERYKSNPVLFVREVLKAEPEDEQILMLESVRDHRMTAVKTTTLSWLVLWFMFTRPFPKIPCTAPTMHRLRDILWAEISKWLYRSPILQDFFDWTVERVTLKTQEDNWFAVARTATQPDAMQGFHADSLLFIIDEASGVSDAIFEPILGALTGKETKFIMVGNPTKTVGFFYNAFTKNASEFNCITLNAENSRRVSKEFIAAVVALYGIDSDPYRVRVLGQFPKSQPDTFISLDLIEKAYCLYNSADEDKLGKVVAVHLGVDVARFGDDESTIYLSLEYSEGKYISRCLEVIYKNTTVELTGRTKAHIRVLNELYKGLIVNVNVDGTGVGAGVVDELDGNHGDDLQYKVIEQTFGGQGGTLNDEPIRYSNNTGLIWGNIKRLLMSESLYIEDDSKLTEQLSARKYTVDEDGFIQLERKAKMKERGVSSPDRADGLGLSLSTNLQHFAGMLNY